jgi:general secretion pathway protein A
VYEAFYGLSEKPFSIVPDPDFLFWAPGHEMAYSMLEYGILNQAGVTVVTGGIGCGKTTLIRQLLRNLDEHVTVGLLTNTIGGRGKLLKWVMLALDQTFEGRSYVGLYYSFQKFLIEEYAKGRHVILVIDEAQNLGAETLEELRMLSNINSDKDQLGAARPHRPAAAARSPVPAEAGAVRPARLGRFSPESSRARRGCRLYRPSPGAGPGRASRSFRPRACDLIATASQGIPRTINILCDKALVYGFSANAALIGPKLVAQVLEDRREFGIFSDTTGAAEPIPFRPRSLG